ncbi:cell division protein FtsQ/DivIB [Psychrobacillus vulpis]|uniref:Cell division protein DivIB n=1 Tax=Psychrobacillus vulpis TaxID=2325572 RepID=A0A544TG55_9BACI|nr:FtsQ-type POTRA domain-containing protein [Psychrobacillus vulpis]TQR16475.1 FtsQ-type POTRA domain-containing protein [Psychrobacillus vulpis]
MEKVIDIEDRIPTLKERRRRRTNKKFSILLFLFVTTLLIVLYFQSSYSQIQTISVSGASLVPKEQYIEQSSLKLGDSMWSFKEQKITKLIEQNDWVKSVNVKRNWLTEVDIRVEEYKKIGYVENGDRLHIILENGKNIETDGQVLPEDGPILAGFDDEKIRIRLIKELEELDSEVLQTISQINYTPTDKDVYSIQVFMNDGNEVQAIIPSFSEKMNYYPSIVSQLEPDVKGIIDLEVGTFFQPYKEVYSQEIEEEAVEVEEEQAP